MSNTKDSKVEKTVIEVESDSDNVGDDDSSSEGTWADAAANATRVASTAINTPPNENATRGRGGARGRGSTRGRGNHTRGGQTNRAEHHNHLQTIIDTQNNTIAKQTVALSELRANFASLQAQFVELTQKHDVLVAEKQARLEQKEARRANKIRETITKHTN